MEANNVNGGEIYTDSSAYRRLNSRYDSAAEQQVLTWINQIVGENIPFGRENAQRHLKDGIILVKLINAIYDGTSNLPPLANQFRRPLVPNTSATPFKQMENIQNFLDASECYGVPKTSLFQTVDLYEARNMSQVINTLMQLGTECQRNGFQGPVCGPRPTQRQQRQWSNEQLRASEGILCLQSGTNKFASQKGMSFGAVRHVADIRCDDVSKEGQGIITLQYGTNLGASQKGMAMGGVRHGADIRCDDMSKEGQATITLQYGTNKYASQSGMRGMGAQRHIADIRCDKMTPEGAAHLGLQMGVGANQVATQSGMSFGAHRHINDIY